MTPPGLVSPDMIRIKNGKWDLIPHITTSVAQITTRVLCAAIISHQS